VNQGLQALAHVAKAAVFAGNSAISGLDFLIVVVEHLFDLEASCFLWDTGQLGCAEGTGGVMVADARLPSLHLRR